jgi:light-harvesting complex I chlorophyll a/b binding protein 4
MQSEVGVAGLKPGYINGDLGFDPLGLKPKGPADYKTIATKELNNGR